MGKHILLLSCTNEQKKYLDPQKAVLVYNDEIYKFIREKLKDESLKDKVEVLVLSSKFNVIPITIKILPYETEMTKDVAEINISMNTYLLKKYAARYSVDKIVACLEKGYENAATWDEIQVPVEFLDNENRKKVIEDWFDSI